MNLVDILVAAAILLAGLLGYRDGFFRKTFGILSFLVGVIVATTYMGGLGRRFTIWSGFSMEITSIVSFFIIFVLIIALQNIVFKLIAGKDTSLKQPSRFGGALLGLFQGVIVASLILVSLRFFDLPDEPDRRDSILYRPVLNVAPQLFDGWLYISPQSKAFYETLKEDLKKIELFE